MVWLYALLVVALAGFSLYFIGAARVFLSCVFLGAMAVVSYVFPGISGHARTLIMLPLFLPLIILLAVRWPPVPDGRPNRARRNWWKRSASRQGEDGLG